MCIRVPARWCSLRDNIDKPYLYVHPKSQGNSAGQQRERFDRLHDTEDPRCSANPSPRHAPNKSQACRVRPTGLSGELDE